MKKQNIIWIDVESTGIDANHEHLLQIALRVTDQDLNFLDGERFERKVFYTPEEVTRMKEQTTDYVLKMHTETALWDALFAGEGVPLNQVEEEIMEHLIKYVPEPRTARFAGNSITLDRNFVNTYLPALGEHIHYRSFDISTVAGMVEMWSRSKDMYHKAPSHEAMDDITQSVREFMHYRDLLFPVAKKETVELAGKIADAKRAVDAADAQYVSNPVEELRQKQAEANQHLLQLLEQLTELIPA